MSFRLAALGRLYVFWRNFRGGQVSRSSAAVARRRRAALVHAIAMLAKHQLALRPALRSISAGVLNLELVRPAPPSNSRIAGRAFRNNVV